MGWENDVLKIRLAATPQKGEANQELIRFLAKMFGMAQRDIVLIQGATSRHKKIRFVGKTKEELLLFLNNRKDDQDDQSRKKSAHKKTGKGNFSSE